MWTKCIYIRKDHWPSYKAKCDDTSQKIRGSYGFTACEATTTKKANSKPEEKVDNYVTPVPQPTFMLLFCFRAKLL